MSVAVVVSDSGNKGKVDLSALFTYLAEKLHINEVHVEAEV